MKARHIASTTMVTVVLSLGGTFYYLGWSAFNANMLNLGGKGAVSVNLGDVPPVDKQLQTAVEELYSRVGELARPRAHRSGEVNYRMLGFREENTAGGRTTVSLGSEEHFDDHVVSMAYVTDRQKYAVIDGKLYKEGDRIEESGGHVRTITPDKVLIAGREVRQWLEVKNRRAEVKAATREQTAGEAGPDAAERDPEARANTSSVLEAVQALKGMSEVLQQLRGGSPGGAR